MFQGDAEAAMKFYVSLFRGAEIEEIARFGPSEAGPEGSVKLAQFSLCGQAVKCIDSPVKHAFSFTPSFSFFVECDSEDEINRLYGELSKGGQTLMPIGNYPFSRRFAWVSDRFGVSWQLSLK
jgi:predicted 3-demethylubiquinone-9 3-methyltransferase (glyoxalase superfamily)